VPVVAGPKVFWAAGEEVPVHGPGKVPMEFTFRPLDFGPSIKMMRYRG
jgi:hypothetical protein